MKKRFRTLLIFLPLLCAAASDIAPAAHAQDVTASQPWDCIDCPTQEVIDRSTGALRQKSSPGLPEQIQIMGRQMTSLMQFLQDSVVKDFTNWAMSFSQMLAGGL
ncbi:MAG: hypothetical protein J2P21_25615 [Chloracidobacterium sp.]|nr:hypothetical protein [Chloracidobacterium sp.]